MDFKPFGDSIPLPGTFGDPQPAAPVEDPYTINPADQGVYGTPYPTVPAPVMPEGWGEMMMQTMGSPEDDKKRALRRALGGLAAGLSGGGGNFLHRLALGAAMGTDAYGNTIDTREAARMKSLLGLGAFGQKQAQIELLNNSRIQSERGKNQRFNIAQAEKARHNQASEANVSARTDIMRQGTQGALTNAQNTAAKIARDSRHDTQWAILQAADEVRKQRQYYNLDGPLALQPGDEGYDEAKKAFDTFVDNLYQNLGLPNPDNAAAGGGSRTSPLNPDTPTPDPANLGNKKAQAPYTQDNPATVATQADKNNLPVGSYYIYNGQMYRKDR